MKHKGYLALIVVLMIMAFIIASSATHKVDCKYSNYNGSFTFEEINFQERDFDMATYKFKEFKKIDHRDTVLYRLCKINPLEVWNWGNYLFEKKFRLPYASWDEIKSRRGEINLRSGFQDF